MLLFTIPCVCCCVSSEVDKTEFSESESSDDDGAVGGLVCAVSTVSAVLLLFIIFIYTVYSHVESFPVTVKNHYRYCLFFKHYFLNLKNA